MNKMSEMRELNGQKVLYVDDEPFLILSFQLNCDSCYDPERIDRLMYNAEKMGCNSVALLLYWRLIEPKEGKYDYSILASMVHSAEKYGMRIVLVWFGSYKNATMHYAPDWITENHMKYRRVLDENGNEIPWVACPTCHELIEKDKQAVVGVFGWLKEYDTTHRVILFQVNNETGLLGGTARCHCPACEAEYAKKDYPALYGKAAEEGFTAEKILAFQEQIAEAAKKVYPLPCYMNAWLAFPTPESVAGYTYPSGGPNYRMLDIYCAQKKQIDMVCPDIYVPSYKDFHRVCRDYKRENNPLYVAEHALGSTSRACKNVYYAFGDFAALGFDPWAIDCAYPDMMEKALCDVVHGRWNDEAYEMCYSYQPIRDAMIPVAENMGTENLKFWVEEDSDTDETLDFGDVIIRINYAKPKNGQARGMAIRLGKTSFLLLGCYSVATFYDAEGHRLSMKKSLRGIYKGRTFIQTGENTMMGQDRGKQRLVMHEGQVHKLEIGAEISDRNMTDVDTMVDITA